MAVIMLGFMMSIYKDPKKNVAIFAGSAVVFAVALWPVRSQQTIDDVDYMKAMIPHHSIAIMTSERAHIRDPRTRQLAREIIEAQRREIAEMKYLIAEIEHIVAAGAQEKLSCTALGGAPEPQSAAVAASEVVENLDLGGQERDDRCGRRVEPIGACP
jgi:hypothetical protein